MLAGWMTEQQPADPEQAAGSWRLARRLAATRSIRHERDIAQRQHQHRLASRPAELTTSAQPHVSSQQEPMTGNGLNAPATDCDDLPQNAQGTSSGRGGQMTSSRSGRRVANEDAIGRLPDGPENGQLTKDFFKNLFTRADTAAGHSWPTIDASSQEQGQDLIREQLRSPRKLAQDPAKDPHMDADAGSLSTLPCQQRAEQRTSHPSSPPGDDPENALGADIASQPSRDTLARHQRDVLNGHISQTSEHAQRDMQLNRLAGGSRPGIPAGDQDRTQAFIHKELDGLLKSAELDSPTVAQLVVNAVRAIGLTAEPVKQGDQLRTSRPSGPAGDMPTGFLGVVHAKIAEQQSRGDGLDVIDRNNRRAQRLSRNLSQAHSLALPSSGLNAVPGDWRQPASGPNSHESSSLQCGPSNAASPQAGPTHSMSRSFPPQDPSLWAADPEQGSQGLSEPQTQHAGYPGRQADSLTDSAKGSSEPSDGIWLKALHLARRAKRQPLQKTDSAQKSWPGGAQASGSTAPDDSTPAAHATGVFAANHLQKAPDVIPQMQAAADEGRLPGQSTMPFRAAFTGNLWRQLRAGSQPSGAKDQAAPEPGSDVLHVPSAGPPSATGHTVSAGTRAYVEDGLTLPATQPNTAESEKQQQESGVGINEDGLGNAAGKQQGGRSEFASKAEAGLHLSRAMSSSRPVDVMARDSDGSEQPLPLTQQVAADPWLAPASAFPAKGGDKPSNDASWASRDRPTIAAKASEHAGNSF